MCVILACEDSFPSYQTLIDAEMMNRDGGGVAWLNDKKEVEFVKGVDAETIHNMIETNYIKLPCVIHFRISTVGGTKKSLCHPFVISKESPLDLTGKLDTKSDGVLFHNGTVSEYEVILREAVMMSNSKMLKGDYSDSRIMAFVSALYGHEFLKLIKGWNKFCVLDSNGITKYGKWDAIEKGVTGSNNYFKASMWSSSFYNEDFEADSIVRKYKDFEDDPEALIVEDGKYYKNPHYNPKTIDAEIDTEIRNDEDALNALFDEKTKSRIENDIRKGLENLGNSINEKPYYSKSKKRKSARQKDIDFLRHCGWVKPESLSNKQLLKAVEDEQFLQKKKREFLKLREKNFTLEEYEDEYNWLNTLSNT